MQSIIVGIDPGTTIGYAILDINGKIIDIGSQKNISLSDFILRIYKHGTPIIAGTDKHTIPYYIENFAAKTGCRVVYPKQDLLTNEKRLMIKDYESKSPGTFGLKNVHELDALSSAINAFEKYKQLFRKVDFFLEKNKGPEYSDQLKAYLVKNEELNIVEAYKNLTRKPEEIIAKIPRKREIKKPTRIELESQNRIALLQSENEQLRSRIQELSRLLQKIQSRPESRGELIVAYKEQRLKKVIREYKLLKRQYVHLNKQFGRLYAFMSNLTGKVVLKKMANLGMEEFEKKKNILNIQEGDVLLVDNPNILNERVYEIIKGKVKYLVFKQKPTEKKDFIYIEASSLNLEENHYFASVSWSELEKSFSKKDLLKNIVEEYKKERAK